MVKKKKSKFNKIIGIICGVSLGIILGTVLLSLLENGGGTGSVESKGFLSKPVEIEDSIKSKEKAQIDTWEEERREAEIIEAQTATLNLEKYLLYVGSDKPISQEYIDYSIKIIDVVNDRGQDKKVEQRAWYYFKKLKKYLEDEEGIIVDLDYGYRSLQDQQDLIDEMTEEFGADYAEYYAAAPGDSEHHTGLAIDVCLIVDGVVIDENVAMNAETEIFSRIHNVLPEFGFILNFPYENWHFRFVGSPEIARAYYSSGMTWPRFSSWYIASHPAG